MVLNTRLHLEVFVALLRSKAQFDACEECTRVRNSFVAYGELNSEPIRFRFWVGDVPEEENGEEGEFPHREGVLALIVRASSYRVGNLEILKNIAKTR